MFHSSEILISLLIQYCTVILNRNNNSFPFLYSAELELKEAEVRQLRVQAGGDPATRADFGGSGRLVQLEAELKMAKV